MIKLADFGFAAKVQRQGLTTRKNDDSLYLSTLIAFVYGVWIAVDQVAATKCSVRSVAHQITLRPRWSRRRSTASALTCGSFVATDRYSFLHPRIDRAFCVEKVFWCHSVHPIEWVSAIPRWRRSGSLWKNLCRVLLLPWRCNSGFPILISYCTWSVTRYFFLYDRKEMVG